MSTARRDRERGATLVEYALGLAVMALGLVGALQYLQSSQTDHLADSGDRIGMPDLDQTYSSTSPTTAPSGGPGTTVPSSTSVVRFASIPSASYTDDNGNKWTANVEFELVDSAGDAVSQVMISGAWDPDANQADLSCTTDANGRCTVSRWNMKQGDVPAVTFTVSNVSGSNVQAEDSMIGAEAQVVYGS